MQNQKVNAVRVIRLKLKIGDTEEVVPLHMSLDGYLLGFQNVQTLKAWLADNADFEPGKVSAPQPITPAYRRDLRLFTSAPCWFEGCEELRQAYHAELEKLGGTGCKGCEKGPLMQKYLKLAAEAQKNDEPTP